MQRPLDQAMFHQILERKLFSELEETEYAENQKVEFHAAFPQIHLTLKALTLSSYLLTHKMHLHQRRSNLILFKQGKYFKVFSICKVSVIFRPQVNRALEQTIFLYPQDCLWLTFCKIGIIFSVTNYLPHKIFPNVCVRAKPTQLHIKEIL